MTQLPLFQLPPVTLAMSFEDLFDKRASETTEAERRARWAQWLRVARADSDGGREVAASWLDAGECHGCDHKRGRWCRLQGLPCTVNPILSFRHALPGMACMGMGHTRREDEPASVTRTPF